MRHCTLTLLALGLAALPAAAQEQDNDDHGRVFYLEPGVTLQRATESGAEEAVVNLPFLPGDRVWTDASGRADFQFPDGTRLRLDSRSKVDYTAHDEGRGERVTLRLWSGGIYLHVRGGNERAEYTIETPGGVVDIGEEGVYRLDADSGEVRLSVYEGEATLDSGRRRITVGAGERTYARRGESPERPTSMSSEEDDFARWDQERERHEAWAAGSRRYLPDELDAYAPELESHGTWYYETEVGYVWRPFAVAGWRPYWNGRWVWTAYGWTWIPGETWGWATSHYGRWGHSPILGWYWIPGRTWGPAWVSWASGGDYVGWCPLGRHDRPVIQPHAGGYAVPRGTGGPGAAWTFVRRSEMGARDLARRRVEVGADVMRELRVAETPRLRPTRDVRELREADVAVPRTVRVRPSPGDSVLELQRDNQTQVGVGPLTPSARRRNRDDSRNSERDSAGSRPDSTQSAPRHPTDARSPARPAEARPSDADRATERDRERTRDPERDVTRRIFRPLSEPRPARSGEEAASRDENRARARDDSRPRDSGSARPRESSPPPRSEPRSEPRNETPRSEPRSSAPRSEPRSASPRSEPRHEAPPPRASAPPPHSSSPPPANSGGGARPRKERE
jgi:hypothetical protein